MNFYAILNLPSPSLSTPPPSPQTIKDAYRRALLTHHPDKSSPHSVAKPTIDEITLAYRTLSDHLLRAAHDKEIRLRPPQNPSQRGDERVFHTGLDTVDLDDLSYDDDVRVWYRACRCGQERGFVVDEEQLEKAAERHEGEVLVGCRGCSLWLRVLFAVVDEGTTEQNGHEDNDSKVENW
jgi:diphthamide biosynthesis protein 4